MEIITPEEQTRLKERLNELHANRPKISQRIAEARELGDLKENAEYHSARELQGQEEAEIRRIEERLAKAQVVDHSTAAESGVVFLGSRVKLREVDSGDEDEYMLVGEASGNPMLDYVEVTISSPMGEALLKSRVGETIRVDAPRGVKKFEIVELL